VNSTARKALEKLLLQAENAVGRSGTDTPSQGNSRASRLYLNEHWFPEYPQLRSFAEKEACNGAFKLAERQGAISINWDTRAGEEASIALIELTDANKLAGFLGTVPRWDIVADAASAFQPYMVDFPVLRKVIDAWKKGTSVRSSKPSPASIQQWLDAIATVKHAQRVAADAGPDVAVRRASTQLFNDSKRIESLTHLVDVLAQGDLDCDAREPEEVCQELGLMKFPSTFLIGLGPSRDHAVVVTLQHGELQLLPPYLGISPPELRGISVQGKSAIVITVENLTTFHEMTERFRDGGFAGVVLILYTGGMPSPSWRRAFRTVLLNLPDKTPVSHWGDVDAGGFRIANKLAIDCAECGHPLRLTLMDIAPRQTRKKLSAREVQTIAAICERWGWLAEAEAVSKHKSAIEQEGVDLNSPAAGRFREQFEKPSAF
jgi:hypothetical protein